MTTFERLFRAEGERLKNDVDYRTEGFYLDIVENISQAMERAKMKKSDLATAMRVSPGRVTNLLRGYRKNLEIKTIVQAALAIGIEPNELCKRRTTPEMVMKWKQLPSGFQNAQVVKENQNGADKAA
jgi:transcriptional regulator with XRE-family HTH domain